MPAIITEPGVHTPDPVGGVDIEWEALTVFPVGELPFTTFAAHDEGGTQATWHWPEFVPPRTTDEHKNWGTSEHPMTRAEAEAARKADV